MTLPLLTHARMDPGQWPLASADPTALAELERRIVAAGRQRDLIYYSNLVAGVTFRIPTLNGGMPFDIDPAHWEHVDRLMIGQFLGAISLASYSAGGVFASALVISKETDRPSPPFFDWMRDLGLLKGKSAERQDDFWFRHVEEVYEWCAST